MSIVNHFINESMRELEISDFLERELIRAGFGGAEIMRTPLGTRIIIYAMKPGVVIGRRGTNIRELTRILEEKFELFNPQIAVSEVEIPELNPNIMASRIADALQRGIHFRRTGFWALNQIMRAGAMGCEIIIKGKLTSRRHRYEKYREGYIPRVGDPAIKNVGVATAAVKMRPGIIGVSVKIIPPDAVFPDQVEIRQPTEKVAPVENETIGQELTEEE